MSILGSNVSKAIWKNHLYTYSPTLFQYFEKYIPILLPDVTIILTHNLYVCPLCVKNYFFETSEGIKGNSEFSLDHVPPESVGGKFKIITCKKCNNKSGEYEAELSKLLNFGSVPDKKYNSIFPKMSVVKKDTGEEFIAGVQLNHGSVNISFNKKAKAHNLILKKFLDDLHSGNAKNLILNVSTPDLNKIHKALLKSAYLICFIWWGYEFVYSKNGEMIRKVLNEEIKYPAVVPTLWHETNKNVLPKGVGILKKENVKQSFIVSLEIKNSTENFTASVLIPNPTEQGWDKLYELDKYAKEKTLSEFECFTIPKSVMPNGYTFAWNNFETETN